MDGPGCPDSGAPISEPDTDSDINRVGYAQEYRLTIAEPCRATIAWHVFCMSLQHSGATD